MKDVFYYLLDATDPETGFKLSMAELWGEAVALIVAGSDTTSTSLAATFFYLTRPENAPATAKLVAELKRTFSNVKDIRNGSKLNECVYLRACLDEAMRLSPPLPGPLPRTVLPGGTIIDGHLIPAGTGVAVSVYALHQNPLYFPQPEKFLPERWLAPEIAEQQSAFMAFSTGTRVCLGKNMAYAEMCTVIARAFWLFAFEAVGPSGGRGKVEFGGEGRDGFFELRDFLMAENDGPVLRVSKRE